MSPTNNKYVQVRSPDPKVKKRSVFFTVSKRPSVLLIVTKCVFRIEVQVSRLRKYITNLIEEPCNPYEYNFFSRMFLYVKSFYLLQLEYILYKLIHELQIYERNNMNKILFNKSYYELYMKKSK